MAETSTYAGTCTTDGTTDGHRLRSALFRNQKHIEVNSYSSTIFVIDDSKGLRKINLQTDEVTTIMKIDSYVRSVLPGKGLLYFSTSKAVLKLDLNSDTYSVIAGGSVKGQTTGSFDDTRFDSSRGLLLLSHEGRTFLLVADRDNNRCAGYSLL